MTKEEFKEFEDYKILDFTQVKEDWTNKYPMYTLMLNGNYSSINDVYSKITLYKMLYSGSCVESKHFNITKIQKGEFIFNIGDEIILTNLVIAKIDEKVIIKAFTLVSNEVVVKFVKDNIVNTVKICNIKHLNDMSDTNVPKTKDNASNALKSGFTLEDIEIVLTKVLDDFEVKEILNDFRTYKRLPIVENKIIKESEFVLADKYFYMYKTKEEFNIINKIFNMHWNYYVGGGYKNTKGSEWIEPGQPISTDYQKLTWEQFEEHVLNKVETKPKSKPVLW